MKQFLLLAMTMIVVALIAAQAPVLADHVTGHTTLCDEAATVGGGQLGISQGPVGPPNSLGWDIGDGQCNGSFATATDASFPGGAIEIGMRAEQRRVGQVTRIGANEYEVQLGNDTQTPPALNRAWWGFQHSISYNGDINTLDALNFEIRTDVGPNVPAAPLVNLVGPGPAPCPTNLRVCIDDRNNQPNATSTYADLYQTSQNPEFGWFAPATDTDANPTGAFDYDQEGAWLLTLTAIEAGQEVSVSICVHTPNADCLPTIATPGMSLPGVWLLGLIMLILFGATYLWRVRPVTH